MHILLLLTYALFVKSAGEHVIKNVVLQTAFNELVLGQYTVGVCVHLGEDFPRSRVRRVAEAFRVRLGD